jgi:DNA-binding IclR family transcriptional regulator
MPPQKRVPAVANALAILELLRGKGNEPQTLSHIARGTAMNVSTCFNILKTLEDGQVVTFDADTKSYRLGLYLAELGALVDEQRQAARLVMDEARRVTDVTGLGCFLMTLAEGGEFVVLDKADSRNPIRVTIDVGARFPTTGAVAAKAWLAFAPDEVIDDLIDTHGLPGYTERSITDAAEFHDELEAVRRRGYATSVSEYYPDHNAVAAPIFSWDRRAQFLFVVVGTSGYLSGPELARVGEEVAAAAERATKRIGGRHPDQPDALEPVPRGRRKEDG